MIVKPFDPNILQKHFSESVRRNCSSCKRFGHSSCCPPSLDSVEFYQEFFALYTKGILCYNRYIVNKSTWKQDWQELGRKSSIELATKLKELRSQFTDSSIYGAGSCKECDKCTNPCSHPEKIIVPIEGCGVNVVNFFKEVTGIQLRFPVWQYGEFYRVGVLLYA